jgi:hypothetical protein
VKAVFVELPPFERYRADYLDDDAFLRLQQLLMLNPAAGALIPGTGGLRKLRYSDERRGKGKRGGLRVIYYGGMQAYSIGCSQFTTKMRCLISLSPNAKC